MAGRPVSITRQRKIAAVVEMNADGKKKHEICAALGITRPQHDEFLSIGRRIYVEQPTREAINQHRERLEAILEVLEKKAMEGKLFSIDRYLQTLDRLGNITGVSWVDRAKTMAPDHGAQIDAWLRGSVEAGSNEDDEFSGAQIIEHYGDDADMAPRELTPENIEEELELAAQFTTPNEPEGPKPATERRKSRR